MEWQLDLDTLDKNQYKAVTAEERFVRVIAGAGSGKTRTLTYRFAYLVQQKHISPDDILCVTFTNKATDEMKKRFKEELLGYEPGTVMTFNRLGNQILKSEIGKRFGWRDGYKILGEDTDFFPIIREIMKKYTLKKSVSIHKITDYIIEKKRATDYLSFIFGDQPTDIDEQIKHAVEKNSVEEIIYFEYLKKQGSEHLIDFTDQVCMPLYMFKRFPDMLDNWSHRFQYILVDEFQDVSDQNYQLCEALTGKSNSLFVVGDPDQVIYGWRDANPDYLQNFHKAHPGTSSIQIMTNYRSSKEIIEGANRVIVNNTTSHNPDSEMTPYHTEEGVKIKYYHAENQIKEAEFIVEQIESLLTEGVVGNKIAVLYRAHKCNADIKQQLKQKEINYEEYNEASLPSMPIIKDVIAFMQFVVFLSDNDLYYLENTLNYYGALEIDIDPFFLRDRIAETKTTKYETIQQIIKDEPGRYPKSEKFVEAVKTVQTMDKDKTSTLADIADYIIDEIGITEYLHSCLIDEEEVLIDTFMDTVSRIDQQTGGTMALRDFLQEIAKEPSVHDDNAVQLMTIHAAKGLEFDYVFVIQMTYDTMPSNTEHFKKSGYIIDLEEERRVAYVAYTRAMKELCLSDYAFEIENNKVHESEGHEEDEPDEDGDKDKKGQSNQKGQIQMPSHYILEAGLREGYIDQLSAPLPESVIIAADKAYKQIEWIVKFRTQTALGKLPLFLEVEHVLYGHGTITGVVQDKGAVKVKFDGIQQEITITDFLNLRFIIPEDRKEEALADELFKDMPPRDDDDPLTQRVKKVLNLLNDTAVDEAHRGQVSVLALPCGAGKSSAISLKICQTIAAYKEGSKEGILIISNNTEQLNRYLSPRDVKARQYINEHYNSKKKLITLMNKDNKKQAMRTMKYSPVLIITTQRYFRLDYFELVKRFLTFGKDDSCRRTLIIIDEEPTVCENISISATELNLIDSAIKRGLTDQFDQEEKEFCVAHWSAWRQYLDNTLKEFEQKAISAGKDRQYSYFSDHNRRHAIIEVNDPITGSVSSVMCNPWASKENMARFYRDMADNMYSLNFALDKPKKKKDQKSIFDLIRALYEMTRRGAVHEFSSESTGHYTNQFSIRVDNALYFHPALDAKIIVLDGTGDLSPVYADKERFDVPGCSEFSRQLNNLTIKIYDVATGKTALALEANRRAYVFDQIRRVVTEEIPATEPWAIFTSEEVEKFFKEEFTTATVEHFGNIRGKNEFKDMQYIVQAGMFRCPPSYYFLFEVDADPKLAAQLNNMSENGEDTSNIIGEHIDTGYSKECMDRLLLCDIEQNLFRGIIRIAETTTPYTYYLFISRHEYKDLIKRLYERYHNQLGANVLIEKRKTTKGDLFKEWYVALDNGYSYTTQDIRDVIGIPESAKVQDYFKRDPDILEILRRDNAGKGKYIKGIGGQSI